MMRLPCTQPTFEIIFKVDEGGPLSLQVAGFSRASSTGPSRTYGLPSIFYGDTLAPRSSPTPSTFDSAYIPFYGTVPYDYIVLVVYNAGTAPLNYRVAVNVPQACIKACGDYYRGALGMANCPTAWCDAACARTGGCDASTYSSCLSSTSLALRRLVVSTGAFCPFACTNITASTLGMTGPLRLPLAGQSLTANPCGNWESILRTAGGATTTAADPAGFIPIRSWPVLNCTEVVDASCPTP